MSRRNEKTILKYAHMYIYYGYVLIFVLENVIF